MAPGVLADDLTVSQDESVREEVDLDVRSPAMRVPERVAESSSGREEHERSAATVLELLEEALQPVVLRGARQIHVTRIAARDFLLAEQAEALPLEIGVTIEPKESPGQMCECRE